MLKVKSMKSFLLVDLQESPKSNKCSKTSSMESNSTDPSTLMKPLHMVLLYKLPFFQEKETKTCKIYSYSMCPHSLKVLKLLVEL